MAKQSRNRALPVGEKTLFDLHVHSKFSYDSNNAVEAIVAVAKKKGLSGVAITDHNTIKGGLEGKKFSGKDFAVIVGAEYSTDIGHILGLFLKNEISQTSSAEEVIEEIHSQGGLAILAHPYKYADMIPLNLLKKLDGIEVFNSRAENLFWSRENNQKALQLYRNFEGSSTAGSDAHFLFEVGRAATIFDCDLVEDELFMAIREGRVIFRGLKTTPLVECLSQFVKSVKRKRYRIALRAFFRTGWRFLYSVKTLCYSLKAKKLICRETNIY